MKRNIVGVYDFELNNSNINTLREGCKKYIDDLRLFTYPHEITNHIIDFIMYYGGFSINCDSYYFEVYGYEPMCEEIYTSIINPKSVFNPSKDGLLEIGCLHIRNLGSLYPFYFFVLI